MTKFRKYWTLLYIIAVILGVIFFLSQPTSKKLCFQQYENEESLYYSGIVKAKYRDSTDHYDRKIELMNHNVLMEMG